MNFKLPRVTSLATAAAVALFALYSGCSSEPSQLAAEASARKAANATATANSPTIVVNASSDLSASGRDDIATMRAMFQSASRPESSVSNGNGGGGMGSTAAFTRRIGMNQFRAINIEDDCKLDAQGVFVPCDRLVWPLDDALARGYKAHLVVGLLKPNFIAGDAWTWDAAKWNLYQDYAYKLVRYVVAEHGGTGLPAVDFEPTNEWDINVEPGHVWPLQGTANNIAQFDPRRYPAFLRVYGIWAQAVDRVHREFPGKAIRIGGPASGWGTQVTDGELWHEKIVREMKTNNLRVDFITYHYYGDSGTVGNGRIGSNNVPPLIDQIKRVDAALVAAGLPRPIAFTE
jgi:hypothetical protein